VEIAKTINKICNVIISRFNGAVEYLQTAVKLLEKYYKPQMFQTLTIDQELASIDFSYIKSLSIQPFKLCTNFGKQLSDAKHIKKDMVNAILIQSYILDFFKALVLFKNTNQVNFIDFVENTSKIVLEIKGLHHPCLENSVKNDMIYDKNIIITGPNAGGKSTCIKSVLINVLLMQTVGLCCADSCKMTLFKNIVSQINIPDCKGSESLFEAEMHRCHDNLKLLQETDQFTLIVMDEIFNSTNPIEGIAGAYAIAKKIGEHTNCFLMFTTHYIYLTKLERDTNRFMNFKMNVVQGETITFPYILERGRSKQCIALELLKQNGFEPEIVDEAIKIKNRLKC
jgi:DNA mismatch repair ATPase MutS